MNDFDTKFRNAPLNQINYALRDIKETLALQRDYESDYSRKLWAEWDYLITLKQKRMTS